ncbi:MAG: hypothetical protein ABIL76_07575, partial [candidate division WOR-3 bacterium]
KNLVKWCNKYGIRTHATFTFGLLGETKQTMKESLEFAKRLDVDSIQFSIATPYPGTKFYSIVTSNNWLTDFDWLNYDGSCRCVVSYPNLKNYEIEKLYSIAFKQWFINKIINLRWLYRQIKIIFRMMITQELKYNINFIKRLFSKIFI